MVFAPSAPVLAQWHLLCGVLRGLPAQRGAHGTRSMIVGAVTGSLLSGCCAHSMHTAAAGASHTYGCNQLATSWMVLASSRMPSAGPAAWCGAESGVQAHSSAVWVR
jgi:hypothetical protein